MRAELPPVQSCLVKRHVHDLRGRERESKSEDERKRERESGEKMRSFEFQELSVNFL